jgi:hypothetical protein
MLENIHFHILTNILLFVGISHGCVGMLPRMECGIQVLTGLAPSSLTIGTLMRTPWPADPARMMIVLH